MKTRLDSLKSVVCGFALLLLLPNTNPAWGEGAQCGDVGTRGHLNVLTINLAFSEGSRRDGRLQRIADFAHDESVDVIFLQEVVSISDELSFALFGTPGTENSAQDLKDILFTIYGLDYNLRTASEAGIPGVLTVSNGILSRCEISLSLPGHCLSRSIF